MVIELIGGVGAGKSRVLQIMKEEYGAVVAETDQVARQLEEKGQAGYEGLRNLFGDEILEPDGRLNRRKLADMIFSDPSALEKVNALIHPLVWEEIRRMAGQFRAEENRMEEIHAEKDCAEEVGACGGRKAGSAFLVVETALPDKKPDDIYDEVWYVYTLKETRIQRLMESRGYSREKCLSVMENQCTEDEYRALADRVIDNNGSPADVRRQIGEILG